MRIFQPTVTGSNTTTGSLHISGPVYFYTLEDIPVPHILVYNTESGQVNYALSTALETSPFPFTGSAGITGSIVLTGSMFTNGAISASFGENTVGFYGTASWAQNVLTASFITAAGVFGPFGSSSVLSASYASSSTSALTASYLLNPYPIDVTGSSLYSVAPVAGVPDTADNSIFFGNQAGLNSNNAYNSNFLGEFAGKSANGAYNSNFLGPQAGNGATNANDSNFLGSQSGYQATNANDSNFLGDRAGYQATNAQYSNFLGIGTGYSATNAEHSNFLGYDAGFSANNASHSNFLGFRAGTSQDNAAYSTLIGYRAGNKGGVLGNLIGPNNIIIGTNLTFDTNRQDSINIGGIIFGTGSYNDTTSVSFPYSGSTNGRIGINIVYPSYSFHASGSISFPSLTSVPQVNVVVIDTASGQLFYLPTGSVGGGGVTINNNNSNYLITATGTSNTLEGEANLQFDGSTLTVIGNILANSITGSFTGSLTGSLYGTASWAENSITASFALTAAAAPEDTWIQYNKEGLFGATGSFRFIYTSHSLEQGKDVVAFGRYSHAEGSGSLADGIGCHAEGQYTRALGNFSHAEGYDTLTLFETYSYAHAEGWQTTASGQASHAEGYQTLSIGTYSHAEGYQTIANGTAHAEGYYTIALQDGSHSEGYYTTASGQGSHAEGYYTEASGAYSHAEGSGSYAGGFASHAEGQQTKTDGPYQLTIGQFNSTNTSPSAFIIGNGTSDANRSNLLFASGSDVEISGSLYVTSSLFSQGPLVSEGSRVRKYREITLTDSDIGDPPTYSIEEDDDIILIIDTTNTPPAVSNGTLSVTNFLANSPAGRCVEIITTETGTAGTILYIAAGMGGTSNLMLNRVSMANSVREVNNAVGESVTLMAMGLAKTGSIWGNGW